MSDRGKIVVWLVVLLAFLLQIHGLFANTFHSDEALFASWARHIAVWKDPLLLTQPVDKPPLLFYLQALFYPLQGPVEWAARLPNFIVSILLVPLTAVFFRRIYRDEWGLAATAVVVALTPLTIQFSATAFTDPLLTFWLIGALVWLQVASGGSPRHPVTLSPSHPLTSGLFFGLATATKYQAWLFLPLLLGLAWLAGYGRRQWARWLSGLGIVVGFVFIWEFARSGPFSLWSNQVGNFGGVRLIWSWELWPRLLAWIDLGQTAISPIMLVIFIIVVMVLVGYSLRRDDGTVRVDCLLILFLIGYMLLHWLLAVPVWDRYLLPLVPLFAVLIGRCVMILRYWDIRVFNISISQYPYIKYLLIALIVFILLLPAWAARYGRFSIGGTPLADDGAAEIARYLQDKPYGTVLYDHWYSWQWRYHLFDKGVYVSWFPHSGSLIEELSVFGGDENERFLVLPDTAVAQPIIRVVVEAGFQLQPVAREGKIALYQIVPEEVVGE